MKVRQYIQLLDNCVTASETLLLATLLREACAIVTLAAAAGDCPYQSAREFLDGDIEDYAKEVDDQISVARYWQEIRKWRRRLGGQKGLPPPTDGQHVSYL